ncbi:MFS transporter [Corynebacterium nuruki]|uniref:MFS transporter n=1 Tax=Corynebacterium nuruki TaxID=1032851 RepID=UPI0039BFCF91
MSQQFPATPRVIALLVATGLCVLMQLYAAIPLVDPVASDLDTSSGTATLVLSTCFSLSYAAAFLVWGPVADHVGRRPVILSGLALLVVTSIGCALAPNVTLLGVFRALQGIGAASYAPIALAYLTEATAPKHRATSVGAMATAFLVAGITGQVAASALAHEGTWRWYFAGSGMVFLTVGLAVFVLLTEPAHTRETTLAGQFRNLGRLITRPRILLLAGALTTLLLSFVAMYSALGPHLEDAGLSSGAVLVFRLVGLPGMFVTLLAGPLATRIGVAATARVGFLLAAVGLVGEAALSATVVGTALASLVFVTGVALAVPSMITLFGMTSAPHRGAGMALNGFFLFLGASLGPLTTQLDLGFVALLLCLSALLCLAAVLVTGFLRLDGVPSVK